MSNGLRPAIHPGQSEFLVHFCGRARQDLAPEVAFLTPDERLGNIVAEERLRAHATYDNPTPVVCFSESDQRGVEALLRHFHFHGWGIVVQRTWAWAAGGGPVWYVNNDTYSDLRARLDDARSAFLVRTDPGHADWLHEREWRVPGGDLWLLDVEVAALLVSDPDWEPRPVPVMDYDPVEGRMAWGDATPRLAASVPRWHWDGHQVSELPPLPLRTEFWPVQP